MFWLSVLAYTADAWILTAYAVLARKGNDRPLHWANAIGALPLLAVEVATHAYPIIPLHLTFSVIGCYGLYHTKEVD